MDAFSDSLYAEMEGRLTVIRTAYTEPLPFAEQAIKAIIPFIERLKVFFINHAFRDEYEEIRFFKVTKPRFLSVLIYYNEVYTIESNKPVGGDRAMRKFLMRELAKLRRFCRENREFCKYYRTGNDCFDSIYFLRRAPDVRLSLDSAYFLFDPAFSTMQDHKVARLLANDALEVYLKESMEKLGQKQRSESLKPDRVLKWTASKAALVELIYALHTEGAFNNGASDLKDVASFLEAVFGTELGQYHRVFLEIRNRKNERTKFLDALRDKLVRRMEQADER
ncbi:RteC domain-containing protein [Flavobacterium sp. MAH-1]|uniref:RteC domain-containing protein n=1 Tax=Flavobacterium agri TaxID=2743471 RepID=A0A7Y8Y3H0_9FLAO|nr:RteC domain-containing protein [Flavobacterium agri]NUY81885.1 RteC domain-containing protein [Flavobacterium agri]NYA71909.1 RteC domain-containing protein [Flavobacterium agri]